MTRSHCLEGGQRAGFTLLEVVCALAIAGMLMGAVFSALSLTVRAILGTREAVRRARVASGIERILRHDFQAAYRANEVDLPSFVGKQPSGAAGEACLEFFTTTALAAQGQTAGAAINRVAYFVQPAQGASGALEVLRREIPYAPGKPLAERQAERLAGGITACRVRFFNGAEWYEEWSRDRPPIALEVDLAFDGDQPTIALFFSPLTSPGADPAPPR